MKDRKIPQWAVAVAGLLCLVLVLAAVMAVVLAVDKPVVEVRLNGSQEMTMEYGGEFSDPGAVACWYDKILNRDPTELEVTVESDLDTTKVGTYTITYRSEYEDTTGSVTRTIRVVDTQAPQITLETIPNHITIQGEAYQEEGYSAWDDYDGDITDRVERTVLEERIIYTVTDSSGNTTEVPREIVYVAPEAPVLRLLGDAEITINAGVKWTDPGYTAVDFLGESLEEAVTVEGSVKINTPGTYELTYRVTDSYGNTATAKRTVTVKAVKQPDKGTTDTDTDKGEKVIYLTFDDGPGAYTLELLEILEKYNVKATFFVCGTGNAQYLKNIADGGHSIGIHSMTHDYETIYASEDAFFDDLYAMRDEIKKYAGVDTTLMRFPGGSSNSISKRICEGIMTRLTQAVEARGFQYFDWNVDSNDAGGAKTAEEVAQNVINGVNGRKTSVVLQHDIKGFSVDAVEQIILWGLNNGYTFLPLDADSPVCHHGVNN